MAIILDAGGDEKLVFFNGQLGSFLKGGRKREEKKEEKKRA